MFILVKRRGNQMTQAKQTITVRSHVGSDGILRLEATVAMTQMDLEVTVTVQPAGAEPGKTTPNASGVVFPGFLEETFGAWEGEPLIRAPQLAVSPEALGWPEEVLQQTAGTIPNLERPPQSA